MLSPKGMEGQVSHHVFIQPLSAPILGAPFWAGTQPEKISGWLFSFYFVDFRWILEYFYAFSGKFNMNVFEPGDPPKYAHT